MTIPDLELLMMQSTPDHPPQSRIPVKMHRRVCLILAEDAILCEELLARRKLAQDVAGRLNERVLLLRPGRVESVVEELVRIGHTPAVHSPRTSA